MRIAPALLAAAVLLGGCASKQVCPPTGQAATAPLPPDWREFVTDADHVKLRGMRDIFRNGLAQARAAGFGAQVDAEGRLFDPDFAEDGIGLEPGAYHCRIFSLGSKVPGRPAFVATPLRDCSVEKADPLNRFQETNGPQRLYGFIYPDEPARSVFLGTRALQDEATPLHYSRDQDRDTIGAIQHVGDRRWRMTIPSPAWESLVEVVEITPAG